MLTPFVVASGGGYQVNTQANAALSYTIGEMAIVDTYQAQGYFLTNGFQQPIQQLVSREDEFEFAFEFVVFPNPATDVLNFRYELRFPGKVEMHWTDMRGVEVLSQYEDNYAGGRVEGQFDLDGISQGMYFLHVSYEVPNKQIHYNRIHKINVIRQ
jgi:hypothetical protein